MNEKRPRTGTIEPFRRVDGTLYYRGKIRLGNGSRERIDIDPPFCFDEAKARTFVAETQQQEDRFGRILARKLGLPEPAQETLTGWVDRWIEDRRARGIAGANHDKGRLTNHVLPIIGKTGISAVKREDVERVVESLDNKILLDEDDDEHLSWKTASNVWVLVSKMFDDAVNSKNRRLRARTDNPAIGVRAPERGVHKARAYLWPSEFTRLVACDPIDSRFRVLFAVAVYTFMRSGELEALTWDDVDLQHGVINIHKAVDRATREVKSTKSGETRRIPIERDLLPLLRRLHREREGERVLWMPEPDERASLLRQHLQTAGVKRIELHEGDAQRKHLTFHDLRATGITWMAARGDDPLRIRQRAGHKSFSTTEIYIREAENLAAAFGRPFPPLPRNLLRSKQRSKLEGLKEPFSKVPEAYVVEQRGIEPLTSALRTQRSPS